jgi:hypothetical protein
MPVNDVVDTVHKMECRKQGRPSCAKWDMKGEEYRKTMRLLESKAGNYEMHNKVPTVLIFQFHIIAWIDDITNLETGDLRSHKNSVRLRSRPKCLGVKMLWNIPHSMELHYRHIA